MKEGITAFLTTEELQHLERLVLRSRMVVEGTLAGRHRSPLKGASSEFADHRAYIAGDNPRFLDWKVLARTDRYFVRRYEDETNLRVFLVLDRSASMAFTSGGPTKFDYACHVAAALGYVTVKAQDSVGLYLFSRNIDTAVPARSSMAHLNNLLTLIGEHEPSSQTRAADALHRVADDVRRRALVILFSDLLDDQNSLLDALAHFRKKHHDVIILHVLDPAELDLSLTAGGRYRDNETGETIVASPADVAREYARLMEEFINGYRQRCLELNIDYRLLRTDRSPIGFIRAYLQERKRST